MAVLRRPVPRVVLSANLDLPLGVEAQGLGRLGSVAVLEGEGTETVQTRNGQVVLNVGPLLDQVKKRLDDRGITDRVTAKSSGSS